MATRMQQRRGTATQWTNANPILASGEIGWETDTNKFKIGNGLATWATLQYFNDTQDLLDLYVPLTQKGAANGVATLDNDGKLSSAQIPTIDELTQDAINAALVAGTGLDKTYDDGSNTITLDIDGTVATKTYADTVAATAQSDAENTAASALNAHAIDTTNVHGIADVAALALTTDVQDLMDFHAADTTNVHGIADTSALATQTDVSDAVSAHNSDTTNVHGIADTSVLLTTAGGTVSNLTITGDLTVQGTTTTVDAANLEVTDSLIYLASEQFNTDVLDIGIYGAYGDAQAGHLHTGLIRDASDGKWKLVSGGAEPTSSEVDFSGITYDTLKVGSIEGNVVGDLTGNADTVTNGVYTTDTGTVTNAMLAGSIANDKLEYSSITLNGSTVSLGGSASIESLPSQTGNTGKYLTTDGSAASWSTVEALPSQTGHSGQYLTTNGSVASWATVNATPALDDLTDVTITSATANDVVVFDGSGFVNKYVQAIPTLTNSQTGTTYTTVLSDAGKIVEISNASAITLTIPTNASVAYPVGTQITILQTGAGQITVAAPSGGTLNATPGTKLRTQWSSATLLKRATDTWVLIGDLTL